MKTNTPIKAVVAAVVLLAVVSCKKNHGDVANPVNPNETELITTVKLIVYPVMDPSAETVFAFTDADGAGGNAPSIDTIRLLPSTEYHAQILVLDETKNPVDTTTKEIEEERNAHQFFYTKNGSYDLTTNYLDFDDHNVPLGLNMEITTGAAFTVKTNQLKVVLKHQPGLKPTSGQGDSSLGETDIEVDFPILVQ